MRRALRAVALLAAFLAAAPSRGAEELWGRTIERLSFRGDAPIEEEALARLTDLGPGKTLDERAVRSSLRNLFATGRFADLALEVGAQSDGELAHTLTLAREQHVESPGSGVRTGWFEV